MNHSEAIRSFYAGRKAKAIVEAVVAAMFVLVGGLALTRSGVLVHQFGLTVLFSSGIFMLPMRVRDYFLVDTRFRRTRAMLLRSQTEFQHTERAYVEELIANLQRNYLVDAIAVLGGIALIVVGVSLHRSRLVGRGAGLLVCAVARFAGEAWEQRDTTRYIATLPEASGDTSWMLTAQG